MSKLFPLTNFKRQYNTYRKPSSSYWKLPEAAIQGSTIIDPYLVLVLLMITLQS